MHEIGACLMTQTRWINWVFFYTKMPFENKLKVDEFKVRITHYNITANLGYFGLNERVTTFHCILVT